ncbi:MAG: glycosyltransferase, partial [Candidatus Angelobacter sp.]
MRVGFDGRWYNDSGIGTYVAELIRAMAPLLNGVELVVYENPKNPLPLPAGAGLLRKPVRASRYSLAEQFELAHCCRRDRLSVFHSPFYIVPIAAVSPVVVTIHDLIPFCFPLYSWPKQSLVKLGYRTGLAKAAHIISVSENTAQDLRSILHVAGERISSVHHGVRANVFRPEPRKAAEEINYLASKYGVTPPYVVAASTRNWRTKNLESALAALDNAQHQVGARFQTVVFGPDDGLKASGCRAR